jgi:hypothetical protein
MDVICGSVGIESDLDRRFEDSAVMLVESIFLRDLIEDGLIEKEIDKLLNLYHPCITALIGPVFVAGSPELKSFGLSSESELLFEVIEASPRWRTPTAKAKAVAGLVLGLRFVHSLGLIHGCFTTTKIVSDLNHRIQITDSLSRLSRNGLSDFSRDGYPWICVNYL